MRVAGVWVGWGFIGWDVVGMVFGWFGGECSRGIGGEFLGGGLRRDGELGFRRLGRGWI